MDGSVETPTEARRVAATAAPRGRRLAAAVIDYGAAFMPIVMAVALHSLGVGSVVFVPAVVVAFAILVVNEVVLVARCGQSVGKNWMALKIVDARTMKVPGLGQALLREAIASAQFGLGWHPFTALPNFLVILGPWPLICYGPVLFDKTWHRGLHDRWSHTLVIDIARDSTH